MLNKNNNWLIENFSNIFLFLGGFFLILYLFGLMNYQLGAFFLFWGILTYFIRKSWLYLIMGIIFLCTAIINFFYYSSGLDGLLIIILAILCLWVYKNYE